MKEKRIYQKPSMKVVLLRRQPQLLAGSTGDGGINPMGEPENL